MHFFFPIAIKELVTDANFECSEEGLVSEFQYCPLFSSLTEPPPSSLQKLQAMDNSHVALVAVHLKEEAFTKFRCDHPMPLGVNLTSLTKVLKCAKDDDKVTLKASDDADTLNLTYEAPSKFFI